MHKFIYSLTHAFFLSLLLIITPLHADELSQTNQRQTKTLQHIEAFKQTDSYTFAPQTTQRANALLGASLLASEQGKIADANDAIVQAEAKLNEAKQTATAFATHFSSLIRLRRDALTSAQIIATSGQSMAKFSPTDMIKPGNRAYDKTIANHESGELNQAQAQALEAQKYFQQLLSEALPRLIELTASAVGKAANGGGKQYAPQIYQAAKDGLAALRAYHKGLNPNIPNPPEQALYLAREARHMADQVKLWRKKTRSHEEIILKQRRLNLQLANALHISTASNPMLVNIAGKDLLTAVQKLNKTLADERLAHQQAIAQLKQQYEAELKHQLAVQTNTMTEAQQHRMSTIKEAFRAKLERETFDKKRQQKLHHLFKGQDVKILLNLDGSLLLRLSGLKFAPGKSNIEPAYFDMLSKLSEAMQIYHDRKLRIEGHTDNRGDVKPNQVLSLKRAEAVRDFLISAGADGSRLKALGYGEVRPIASNDFPKGRTMNRRIDVVINAAK